MAPQFDDGRWIYDVSLFEGFVGDISACILVVEFGPDDKVAGVTLHE